MTLQKANLLLSGLVCVLLALLIALVLVTGPGLPKKETSTAEDASVVENALTVQTRRAIPGDSYTMTRDYSGIVQAARKVDLGFSRAGRIIATHASAGDRVDEGDLLAELDTRRLELQKTAYEDALEEAESRPQGQRQPSSGNPVTQTDLDLVELDIEDSILVAPFDAVVTRKLASTGAMASPGHPVFQLIERNFLEALISVPIDVADSIRRGESYRLRIGEKTIESEVEAVLPEVDMTTRTRTVLFQIDGAESGGIQPGSVVRLQLERSSETPGYWLPLSALTRELRGLWSVYAVESEEDGVDRVVKRNLEIIHVEGDRAWVRGTDSEPFEYIAKGVHRVVPGQRVRIKGKDYGEEQTEPETAETDSSDPGSGTEESESGEKSEPESEDSP